MSTPDNLAGYFVRDEDDDTFLLNIWFTREERDGMIDFCHRHGTDPATLILNGVNAMVRACESADGYLMLFGLPHTN